MTQRNGAQISAANPEASRSQSQVLFADDLRKSYGSRVALRGLSSGSSMGERPPMRKHTDWRFLKRLVCSTEQNP
jgi:hypothetical protein